MEFIGPKTKEEINDYLKTRVESLGFSTRIENALTNAGIRTVGGILRKNGYSFYEIDGIGLKGVEEIQKRLSDTFDVKINGKDFQFKPKYYEVSDYSSVTNFKELTEEERIKNENLEKEVKIIEDKYFENIEKRNFIYQVKIISLDLPPEIETILLKNNILSVGGLLNETGDGLRENTSLNDDEKNSILNIFDYFILKNKQIEEEQEELRNKEIELIGRLNKQLEKKENLNIYKDIIINPRNLNIFGLFREGLTLDQIGALNNITRERVRQTIKVTLDKIGLDYEEEKNKIYSKRNDLKPKKIIKEKKVGSI
jgi:DNA-binding CsgD family transcriptional regulator